MRYAPLIAALGLACAAPAVLAAPGAGGPRHAFAERLRAADTNGDGMLSRAEAAALPKLAERFDAIDADHDGQVTREELRDYGRQRRAERWKRLDADGDGRVSLAEAQANAPRLAERFARLDANHDGYLTREELKAAHRHHRRAKA